MMGFSRYDLYSLGASDTDIGLFLTIGSTMALFVNPIYGWMLDKYGPYWPMLLACFVCAIGIWFAALRQGPLSYLCRYVFPFSLPLFLKFQTTCFLSTHMLTFFIFI